jgi:hypothetical protein
LERERCSYIDARKKRFWNAVPVCVLRKNFCNGVPAHSITEIALSSADSNIYFYGTRRLIAMFTKAY